MTVYIYFIKSIEFGLIFGFYKTMGDLSTFELIWCSHGAVCVSDFFYLFVISVCIIIICIIFLNLL